MVGGRTSTNHQKQTARGGDATSRFRKLSEEKCLRSVASLTTEALVLFHCPEVVDQLSGLRLAQPATELDFAGRASRGVVFQGEALRFC